MTPVRLIPAELPFARAFEELLYATLCAIHHDRQAREPRYPSLGTIKDSVAARYRVSRLEMISHRRSRYVARPRQIAMYLSRQLTLCSLPQIGREFGGRDHTTVIHAIRQIEKLRAEDPALDADVRALERVLSA
jgi:chromosomal replication initiation ATPase DnaA